MPAPLSADDMRATLATMLAEATATPGERWDQVDRELTRANITRSHVTNWMVGSSRCTKVEQRGIEWAVQIVDEAHAYVGW